MRVLIACEESQEVCKAFRALGHEAYSCDILPASGGHPEWHIQDDVLKHLDDGWDLMIAHPPCTYLSKAGARWLYRNGQVDTQRLQAVHSAREFFLALLNANIPLIAVENPTPLRVANLPAFTQAIQPYEYGHEFSKRTLLWLKGLPPLQPENIVAEHRPYISSNTGGAKRGQKVSHGVTEPRARSKTFPGIAAAMARQWSTKVLEAEALRTPPNTKVSGIRAGDLL